ncbi:MAG: hypothetical protein CVU84_14625 [Firmicutes bacterium HGW-Firmicutes-1]|jgi:ribosomal protein S12 methylthiotransferase accessory factor|nr:MAG: hypothetical protein CVU84_14625 [Firmicutes bacterium HGW-Firmicutes-1]
MMKSQYCSLAKIIYEAEMGKVCVIEKMGHTKNEVYKVIGEDNEKYLIKLFLNEGDLDIKNCELIMYEVLGSVGYLKKCFKKDFNSKTYNISYVITEYLEGRTLLEVIEKEHYSEEQLKKYVKQIYEYIQFCRDIETKGVGNINEKLIGEDNNWFNFMIKFLDNCYERTKGLKPCDNATTLIDINCFLRKYLIQNKVYFENIIPSLIPIDLNLSNFLIKDNDEVVVLDVDAFWSGDCFLAMGEFIGHIYGTHIFNYFIELWSDVYKKNARYLHFYALLSNYSVLTFLSNNDIHNLHNYKPWGNKCTFFDLIHSHRYIVDNEAINILNILKNNPYLNNDWGKKVEMACDREVEIKETLSNIERISSKAGITRVPEITGLDSTGIFAYQCIRPDAEKNDGTFTVFSGKGTSEEQCKVSAIVEGIERFCAEKRNYHNEIKVATYEEMIKEHKVIHPKEFNCPNSVNFSEQEVLEWIPAQDIISGKCYYITANVGFYPYTPNYGRMLFRYFTTGLAGGNTYSEAISHGIAEAIERDAAALNLLLRNYPVLIKDTVTSKNARVIIEKIQNSKSSLNLIIRYITTIDINVPVFSVIIEDKDIEDPLFISGGYGAHPNKEIALINALNEAALSRVSTISGSREDLEKFRKAKENKDYATFKQKYNYWFSTQEQISYDEIEDYKSIFLMEDIGYMCDCLKNAGLEKVLMVDLSNPDIRFPVVKMLIPGIERYSYERVCIGTRAKMYYNLVHNKNTNNSIVKA